MMEQMKTTAEKVIGQVGIHEKAGINKGLVKRIVAPKI